MTIRKPFSHLSPTRSPTTRCPRCQRNRVLRYVLTCDGELVEPRCRECSQKECAK